MRRLLSALLLFSVCLLLTGCSTATPGVLDTSTGTSAVRANIEPSTSTPTTAPTDTPTVSPPTATITPTSAVTPTAALQQAEAPRLFYISMQDEKTGWGLSEKEVFRTAGSGTGWANVTPPDLPALNEALRGYFLDANTGWVIAPDAEKFTAATLYRSADGGVTWQSSLTPFGGSQLYFLNSQTGWALFVPSAGAGSSVAEIYATKDSGATWEKLYAIDPEQPNAPGGLPLSGMKSGLSFVNETRGWVTGSIPMDGYVWLFMTEDGGKTWLHQDIPMPKGYTKPMLSLDPPRFFSDQDGLLPVTIYTGDVLKDFYITHDSGKTWASTTPVASNGIFDFISISSGWVWDGKILNSTKDGGQTWQTVAPNVDLSGVLAQLDFVNETTGWALAMDANGKIQLYKTTDAGTTWNPLFP